MTTTLHAHVSTASSDCDGPLYREYVTEMNDSERSDDLGDVEFYNRVVANTVTAYGSFRGGSLKVEVDDEYGNVSLEWSEPTEEGFRSTSVQFCEDESCDPNQASQRDVYAEMMGY